MSKLGVVCLLCILIALLLHGCSAARAFAENHGSKGLPVPENEATTMVHPEATTMVHPEKVKAEEENIIEGRELIFNVDYHGATTHPPSPPGTGHRN